MGSGQPASVYEQKLAIKQYNNHVLGVASRSISVRTYKTIRECIYVIRDRTGQD